MLRHNIAIRPVLYLTMALLAAGVLMIGAAPTVHAATITVNDTGTAVADDGGCTLIEAITAANTDSASGAETGECAASSDADTITLQTGLTYTLDTVNNNEVVDDVAFGNNGLPVITSVITINGNDATIERSSVSGTPDFRIFIVSTSGDLTLNRVTVSGGTARTVEDSFGVTKDTGIGGGILSLGTLTVKDSTISGNSAGGDTDTGVGEVQGGGIYNLGDTLTITDSIISGNTAVEEGGGIFSQGGVTRGLVAKSRGPSMAAPSAATPPVAMAAASPTLAP